MDVYLYQNEQQVGPYTPDQLEQLLATGQVPRETPAWHEGLPEWVNVSSLLSNSSQSPPPLPTGGTPETKLDTNCVTRRAVAAAIDCFIFVLIGFPLFVAFELTWPAISRGFELLFGVLLISPVVAFIISSDRQATLGMSLCDVALGNKQGNRVGFLNALGRQFASILSYFFFLGFFLCSRNDQKQTLHDLLSKTIVYRKAFSVKDKFLLGLLILGFFAASIGSAAILLYAAKPTSFSSILSDLQKQLSGQGISSTPEIDVPQDPTGYKIESGRFKIIQLISPGRALASKYVYQDGMSEIGDQVYLLRGIPTTLVDDEDWSGRYFEGDNFTYTTTANVDKTIRSYIVVDPVAEKAAAQRQAAAQQAEQAAQQEKEFLADIGQARTAISNTNLDNAADLLTEAEQLKPNDERLDDLKAQLQKAQLGIIAKSFQAAIQSGNIITSLSEFNKAKELAPNDPSLPPLQSQLDGLKTQAFQDIDTKIVALDIAGADKDYSDLASSFPDESRLPEYRAKIVKAKFDLASNAFHQSLQSQDIDGASAKFDEASALIPDAPSIAKMQSDLNEVKFAKESAILKTLLADGQYVDAKEHLSKLQSLNVESQQTNALADQLASAIKNAVSAAIARGKQALAINKIDEANQALTAASALDSSSPLVIGFRADIANHALDNIANAPPPQVSRHELPLTKDKYFEFLKAQLDSNSFQEQLNVVPQEVADRGDWAFFLKLLENSYGWQSPAREDLAPYDGYPQLTISRDDAWDPEAVGAIWATMRDLKAAYLERYRTSPSDPQAPFSEAAQARIQNDMKQLDKFDSIPQLAHLREAAKAFLKDFNAFLVNDYASYLARTGGK